MERSQFQILLEDLVPNGWGVHYRPPNNARISYPCVLYARGRDKTAHADNAPYHIRKRWVVTVVSDDPDQPVSDLIAALPTAEHERSFPSDNLHHDVYNVYA